jgi:hypothetical protein
MLGAMIQSATALDTGHSTVTGPAPPTTEYAYGNRRNFVDIQRRWNDAVRDRTFNSAVQELLSVEWGSA